MDPGQDATVVGLDRAEAARRLAVDGPNALPEPPRPSRLARVLRQLASPLVLTLLLAATVAAIAGWTSNGDRPLWSRFGDPIAILTIVVLNAMLGYLQERRAETALDALRRLSRPSARVIRGGELITIDVSEVVRGDVIALEAGEHVPADAKLTSSVELRTDESALTGESVPVLKDPRRTSTPDTPLAERADSVFMGTSVVHGRGVAVVTATGASTELGKIGAALSALGDEPTPLERKLATFGRWVLVACLVASAILFAWGTLVVKLPAMQVLLEAVTFAVAIIPEGLPAITTITLALGMQRMAARGAVIRSLPAVETLGATTVLCVDKTGTLTMNQMTARSVWLPCGTLLCVAREGAERLGSGRVTVVAGGEPDQGALDALIETVVLCNDASLEAEPNGGGTLAASGDPTEVALLMLARAANRSVRSMRESVRFVEERPFSSERMRMSVVVKRDGRRVEHVKGALDGLLARCDSILRSGGVHPMTPDDRARIEAEAERMQAGAERVIAAARREEPTGEPETGLTFVGMVGLIDPPRPAAAEAVRACRRAGIRVVMITGDHPTTAAAIAHELGISTPGDRVLTGGDVDALEEAALDRAVDGANVFARATPQHKLAIVRALGRRGHVVAMTGDGVNDAPALRKADIGVAMGKAGTDVARQASDLVITDDDISTIVAAVREGRAIYRNTQKVIFFLLSSNAGLSVAVFTASFAGLEPLSPLMVLWINLVTNGLPALALGMDQPEPSQMTEPPRRTTDGLLSLRDALGIAFVGAVMGGIAVGIHALPVAADEAKTLAFTFLAIAPLFHAWSSRSPTRSILSLPFDRTLFAACLVSALVQLAAVAFAPLAAVFHATVLGVGEWALVLALASTVVLAVEIGKLALRRILRAKARRLPPERGAAAGARS